MNTGHTQQPLMTPREVCGLLHIGRSTLTPWTRAGRLVAVTLDNGHRRFLADSPAIVDARSQLQAATRG